jgi:hypothetical protein
VVHILRPGRDAPEAARFIAAEMDKYADLVKLSGAKVD